MLNLSQDIDSLSNFKRNTSGFLEQMKNTGRPVALTVNGKAPLTVQDAECYPKLLDGDRRLECFL